MKVKVCGITRLEDAKLAVALGVDALGFNFYPGSPRYLAPPVAREIIGHLPPFVVPVGVFVNVADPMQLVQQACESGAAVVQLHGDEDADYCRRLRWRTVIKAVRVGPGFGLHTVAGFPVQALLLDSKDDSLFGGTGRSFDWDLASGIASFPVPVILAGGLNPSNVAAAIRRLKPYAVDVCSGVESSPGIKDPAALKAFVTEVRNAVDNSI
jgi:phosphoribosylanthranilate isomerase